MLGVRCGLAWIRKSEGRILIVLTRTEDKTPLFGARGAPSEPVRRYDNDV